MLCKVDLPPPFGPAQLPNPLPGRSANVPCHSFMIESAFALYLVHTLFVARKETSL